MFNWIKKNYIVYIYNDLIDKIFILVLYILVNLKLYEL